MCTNDGEGLSRPYASVLEARGAAVMDLSLFAERALPVSMPRLLERSEVTVVIPSVRAAMALAGQAWFTQRRDAIRALVPGPETAAAVEQLGVQVAWTAAQGFRRSPLPDTLATEAKVYIANAALPAGTLSLPLGPDDVLLPAYHRAPKPCAPWTPLQAREIVQAERLTVLALSPTQRAAFETHLLKLGTKRPARMQLVAMTDRTAPGFSAQFWDQVSIPAVSQRDSLVDLLKYLAF